MRGMRLSRLKSCGTGGMGGHRVASICLPRTSKQTERRRSPVRFAFIPPLSIHDHVTLEKRRNRINSSGKT